MTYVFVDMMLITKYDICTGVRGICSVTKLATTQNTLILLFLFKKSVCEVQLTCIFSLYSGCEYRDGTMPNLYSL